ncbi:MAG: single-stranded-DNA-specific exonuclease RecJ [Lachnospiraceae bacterium]
MKKWVVSAKRADFNELADQYGISPMLARIIRNRDVFGEEAITRFLHGTPADLYEPNRMKDMEKAVELLVRAISSGQKIRIVGDYDIDGICASYLLVSGLRRCGADADVRLPDRVKDGYGINEAIIQEAARDGVDCLLTCDNGIAAREQITFAKQCGMTVIVTDHHEIPYEESETGRIYLLPQADAVVDPKRADCSYPFKEICGAVVAYKLVTALYEVLGIPSSELKAMLPFAAFATVGDVMPLLDENRIIVKYGIEEMKVTSNAGLKALIDVTKTDRARLSPYHIGFVLGPCVNATGRLDTAERALRLFLSSSEAEAVTLASELKLLNDERKEMTQQYTQIAAGLAEEIGKEDRVLVLYLPDCHESLAGIVAGRIKERFYKPVFVLTKVEEGVKGSGRSIESYSMYEEMVKCKELFTKFGGHRMAAGLSMREENIGEFRDRLNRNAVLTREDLTEKVIIDIPMPVRYATKEFISELELLAPYGAGNPKPLFAQKDLLVKNIQIVGKNQNAVKLKLEEPSETGGAMEAICFGDGQQIKKELSEKSPVSIVYYPEINRYMGQERVQLIIQDYQ